MQQKMLYNMGWGMEVLFLFIPPHFAEMIIQGTNGCPLAPHFPF